MDRITNQQQIEEVCNLIDFVQNEITQSTTQIKNYIHYLNTEMIEFDTFLKDSKELDNELMTIDEKIENAEKLLKKVTTVIDFKSTILENNNKIMETISKLNQIIQQVNVNIQDRENIINEANNNIISQILKWKEQKFYQQIQPYQQMIDQMKNGFQCEQVEYQKRLKQISNVSNMTTQSNQINQQTISNIQNNQQNYSIPTITNNQMIHNQTTVIPPHINQNQFIPPDSGLTLRQTNGMINDYEKQLLQNWTRKQLGNIIFDSSIHRWSIGNSEFNIRIMGNRHLVIVIRDIRGNLFGCYIDSMIMGKTHVWREDSEKFLFSLRSCGRIAQPMKFESHNASSAFWLQDESDKFLISLCSCGIYLMKNNIKQESYCNQTNGSKVINYHNIQNALTGTYHFNPQHFVVFQMK